jgi:hypothetical protein
MVAAGLAFVAALFVGCSGVERRLDGGPAVTTLADGSAELTTRGDWNDAFAAAEWSVFVSEVAVTRRRDRAHPDTGHPLSVTFELLGPAGQRGRLVIARDGVTAVPPFTGPPEPITIRASFDPFGRDDWSRRTATWLVSQCGARMAELAGRDYKPLPDTRD